MKKIGLTGGIASGKSTISHWLVQHGYPVIDADKISREIVAPGEPALAKIAEQFGKTMILPTGELDRKKLGALVFQDTRKRRQLDELLHPIIRYRMNEALNQLEEQGVQAAFLDIPLLYENGLETWVDQTLVVAVSEENQLRRLMTRNKLTEDQARARIASQIPLLDKVKRADAVIDNNGSIEESEAQLRCFLSRWSFLNQT
ncbi:dephospho-CoA kinase [Sporolactobacillus shoreicorticis]|uniref:Dephospho-CoA kinase n=1 Tax=Sporolactobacillus shoreicorticis TaxID=1923877 RepID=A0ABW5RZ38_9BACL|nr:dephospho-CoA kinase [Sporolactobacillus shoreicorticis]MCO7124821.1 dephospho-CoA kinase [Sporolactobacillus shoreicorticis]